MICKPKSPIILILIGIVWLFLSSPVEADTSQYYKQPLTSPAQIQSENGGLEATISIDYNIAPKANPIWGINGTGISGSTTPAPYKPHNSAPFKHGQNNNLRYTIGPDVVSLRNYTVQNVTQGTFTVNDALKVTPSSHKKSTWVTDIIGPTLRVKPGDVITLHLINNMPDDRGSKYSSGVDSCIGNPKVSGATCNMTNFHTHGFHDSPADYVKSTGEIASSSTDTKYDSERDYWVGDDVVDSLLPGGNQWDIKTEIPDNHPAGTFWYHPHQHGATAVHLSSGLEGAIIIDDVGPTITDNKNGSVIKTLDGLLADIGATERLMMFQHIPYGSTTTPFKDYGSTPLCTKKHPCEVGWALGNKNEAENDANFAGQIFTGYTLVNGQTYPLIEMSAGHTERWRLINGGVAEPISLQIVKLSDKGASELDSVLDKLVAPNREPFVVPICDPQDTDKVVVGAIAAKSNPPFCPKSKNPPLVEPTDVDQWLADSTNFVKYSVEYLMGIIAYDGITTGQVEAVPVPSCPNIPTNTSAPTSSNINGKNVFPNCVTLSPGNRIDALIQPQSWSAGTYLLLKNVNYDYLAENGAATAEDIVAVLSVTGDGDDDIWPLGQFMPYAQTQYYPPNPSLATATPDAEYEAHFLFYLDSNNQFKPDGPTPGNPKDSEKIPHISFGMAFGSPGHLDYEEFTENMEPIVLSLDQLGEWTVKVEDNGIVQSAHPFHIHTNPFYLTEIQTCTKTVTGSTGNFHSTYTDCSSEYPNRWQDTLLVQPNQIVKFRYKPTDFEGSFVFHCHFVDHEDRGMMRWVKVCAEGTECSSDLTYGLLPDFVRDNL